ncbi:hypothetical protein [Veillonella montpellierensis]|uniref:hypothetical protein n=1 Tax=Veillonella montpellierensis TaxID=187328 RepID=UPI0012DF5B23|nr:hypothetical protein [Veillonella montpellierensis]
MLESKDKSKRNTLDGLYHTVVTLAKESANNGEYQGQYGGRFIPNGNSKGSIKPNEPSTGLGRTKGQSVESSSNYEEMLRYNGNTKTRPLYRSATRNGFNDGSGRVHSKRAGLQNERLERYTLAPSLQHEFGGQARGTLGGRTGNVDRRITSNATGEFRRWSSSADVIDTLTKSDFQIQEGQEHSKAYKAFREVIKKALRNDKVTMSEKMNILGTWFNALEQLEKKYKPNSLSRGENVYQSLMRDSRIYHEMIAYGVHTVLPNNKVAKLFTIGRTAMKVAPRKEMATKETNKMIITHHLGSGGIRHFINQMEHGKGLDNLSTAVTTVDDAFSPALNKVVRSIVFDLFHSVELNIDVKGLQ